MALYIQVRDGVTIGAAQASIPAGHPDYVASWVIVPAEIAPWIDADSWTVPEWEPAHGLDRLRSATQSRLAARRYRAEVSGVTVALGEGRPEPVTLRVDTERDARPNLLGAAVGAQLDPTAVAAWKDANGQFVRVTAPEILILAETALRHIGACYGREAEIRASLDAAEDLPSLLAAAEQIDQGWPA